MLRWLDLVGIDGVIVCGDAVPSSMAAGPIRWVALVEEGTSVPGFDALIEVYNTGPEDLLEDTLATTDAFWHSESGLSARTDLLLHGKVFTHRPDPGEVAAGVAHVTPRSGGPRLGVGRSPAGERVHLEFSGLDDDGLDREGSLVGPEGWLSSAPRGRWRYRVGNTDDRVRPRASAQRNLHL